MGPRRGYQHLALLLLLLALEIFLLETHPLLPASHLLLAGTAVFLLLVSGSLVPLGEALLLFPEPAELCLLFPVPLFLHFLLPDGFGIRLLGPSPVPAERRVGAFVGVILLHVREGGGPGVVRGRRDAVGLGR